MALADKKKYFRKLLAHTSFLTLISTINIVSVVATNQTSLNNVSPLSISSSWSNGPFVSGDNILLGGDHQIVLDQTGYLVNSIDTQGFTNNKITVQAASKLGDISTVNYVGGGDGSTSIEFVNNIELFLIGNNYNPVGYSALTLIAPSSSLGSGKGIVNFGVSESQSYVSTIQNINFDLGTPTLRLDKIGVISSALIADPNTYDYTGPTLVLKAGRKIYANEVQLSPSSVWGQSYAGHGLTGTLTLENNTILDARVTSRVSDLSSPFSGGGNLIVKGSTKILQSVGTYLDPVSVQFTGNDPGLRAQLYGDIYSFYSIAIEQSTLSFENSLLMSGTLQASSSTFDLNHNTLTIRYDTPYPLEGGGASYFFGNNVIYTTVNNTNDFGRIVVDGSNTSVNYDTVTHLDINLRGMTLDLPPPNGREYPILGKTTNGGQIILPDDEIVKLTTLSGGNLFVNWTYESKEINGIGYGLIIEKAKPQAEREQIIKDLATAAGVSPNTITNIINIINPNNTGQASNLGNSVIIAANSGTLLDLINRIEPVVVEATEASYIAAGEATRTVSERISSISAPARFNMAQQDGVSAGIEEEALKYGAWGSTYFSTALQRGRKEAPGYKTTTFGGTVGADTLVNDTTMVGAALSLMKLKIDHRDSNAGDKTHADGYLFSVYGLKELGEKWFVQAVLSVGTNKIKNRENRVEGTKYEIAHGSYTASNYGTELLGGYEYALNNSTMLTPMAGLSYNRISDSWYQESGTTNQNFLITKKADQKLEAIAGARLAFAREWRDSAVTPEVHGLFRYDILNRSPRVDVRIEGMANPLIPRTVETNRYFVNFGFGVSIAKGKMDYGFTYDNYLAKKYVGHQGTLKMRVNF
jgi:outer membrane autotransporter protein